MSQAEPLMSRCCAAGETASFLLIVAAMSVSALNGFVPGRILGVNIKPDPGL
jgi:hypothetical protein